MLTQPDVKEVKLKANAKDPKETLKDLAPVSAKVIDEFYWGRMFGRVQKEGMVWKHGNPWLYPANEFEQLKTIILTTFAADEFKKNMLRAAPADIAASLNISGAQKEKNLANSKAMYKHLATQERLT